MNGQNKELTDSLRKVCDQACLDLAEKGKKMFFIIIKVLQLSIVGERVLGFCDLKLSARYTRAYPFSVEPPNFPQKGLRFLGFISLIDPPRPQVMDAVGKCRMAGIKVIMVTGDHPVIINSPPISFRILNFVFDF